MNKFLTMAEGINTDLDALKRQRGRERMGLDIGAPEGDRHVEAVVVHERPGAKFMYRLQPGDTWRQHPAGGIIVANPERKPLWCHLVDDHYVQEFIEVT